MKIKKLYAHIDDSVMAFGLRAYMSTYPKLTEGNLMVKGNDIHAACASIHIETKSVETKETARRHAREIADMFGAQLIWED